MQKLCAIHTSGKTSSMTLKKKYKKNLCSSRESKNYTLKNKDYRKITFVFWIPGMSQALTQSSVLMNLIEIKMKSTADLMRLTLMGCTEQISMWRHLLLQSITPAALLHTQRHTSKAMVCANLWAKCGVTPCRKAVRLTVKKCESLCVCVHVHKAEEMSNIVQCEACLLCNNTQADQLLLSPTRLTHCERDKHTHMQ